MKIAEMGRHLDIPTCTGGCGLSATRHREGCVFLNVVHFAERRFTRRAARNYLLLAAKQQRIIDEGYLNDIDLYDWMYVALDSMQAARFARELGFRIPSHLFDRQREMCRLLAARRGVKLSRYRNVQEWSRPR